MQQKAEYQKAYEIAIRLLARRAHVSAELKKKIMERGIDAGTAEQVVRECRERGYIDEKSTARLFFESLRGKGYGPRQIRLQMKRRGIEAGLIEEIFSQALFPKEAEEVILDAEPYVEIDEALKAAGKKLSALHREKDPKKRREKLYRFLQYRGFSPSAISEVLRKMLSS